jgi:hypothetical protein
MASGTLRVGRTYQFRPVNGGVVLKDGALWDLTGATVYVRWTKPDGTVVETAATVVAPLAGTVYYINAAGFFTAADKGTWRRNWRVVQGAVDVILEEDIPFVLAA